jgi:hypothetical protein
MSSRSVKSLHRTGRVSRQRASAVAKRLRADLETGKIREVSVTKITRSTTASGRKAIAFHIVSLDGHAPKTGRKTAGKAARSH